MLVVVSNSTSSKSARTVYFILFFRATVGSALFVQWNNAIFNETKVGGGGGS